MFENFPYTDMHQLNLDWIIKIAKDFLDQYTHIQQLIADGEQSLQDLTESGLNQLQEKADNLETLLQEWYNTHSADIANQLADALNDLNAWYTQHQNYLDQTLISKTAAFNSAADAKIQEALSSLPADYSDTVEDVAFIDKNLEFLKLVTGSQFLNNEYLNLGTITPAQMVNGQAHKIDGTTASGSDYSYARFNNISSDKHYLVTGGSWGANWPFICYYDSNDTLIGHEYTAGSTTYRGCLITPPANTSYAILNGAYSVLPTMREIQYGHVMEVLGNTVRPYCLAINANYITNHPSFAYMRNWPSNIVYNIASDAYSSILDKPAGFVNFGSLVKFNGYGYSTDQHEYKGYSQYMLISSGKWWTGFDDGGAIIWKNMIGNLNTRKYLFVGDSWCEGWNPEGSNSGWGAYLASELGLESGWYDIVYHGGDGFANDGFYNLINTKSYSDHYTDVVILGGFNDRNATRQQILDGIQRVKNLCYNKGWFPDIYIGCVGYIKAGTGSGAYENWQAVRSAITDTVLPAYQKGSLNGARYLQMSEYIIGDNELNNTDGYHPTESGNRLIARCVAQGLNYGGTCMLPYRSSWRNA